MLNASERQLRMVGCRGARAQSGALHTLFPRSMQNRSGEALTAEHDERGEAENTSAPQLSPLVRDRHYAQRSIWSRLGTTASITIATTAATALVILLLLIVITIRLACKDYLPVASGAEQTKGDIEMNPISHVLDDFRKDLAAAAASGLAADTTVSVDSRPTGRSVTTTTVDVHPPPPNDECTRL